AEIFCVQCVRIEVDVAEDEGDLGMNLHGGLPVSIAVRAWCPARRCCAIPKRRRSRGPASSGTRESSNCGQARRDCGAWPTTCGSLLFVGAGLPELDRVALGIRGLREATVRVGRRIDLDLRAGGAQLRRHLVEIADAEVDHPLVLHVAEILGVLLERREG